MVGRLVVSNSNIRSEQMLGFRGHVPQVSAMWELQLGAAGQLQILVGQELRMAAVRELRPTGVKELRLCSGRGRLKI